MVTVSDGYDGYEDQRWTPSDEDRAWMAEMAREYDATPAPGLHVVNSDDTGAGTAAAVEHLMPRLDWSALFAEEDEGERWILEPLIAEGRSTALYSKPKAGKSLLVLEVAVNVSRGFAALGVKPPRPYRVLYVDFENDPRGDVRQRLESMGYDQDIVETGALDNLIYLSFPTISKLDTAQGGGELLAAVDHYCAEVVIIDTVSRTVGGEENDNNTWLNFYRNTGLALKQRGVAMLRLDHSGKDAEKGMRGGSAKYGDVDMVWRLAPASETVLELECTDHRMRVESTRLTLVRETDPDLYHRVAAGHERAGMSAREKDIIARLDAMEVPLSAGREMVRKALREAGLKVGNDVLTRIIRERKAAIEPVPDRSPGQPVDGLSGDSRTGTPIHAQEPVPDSSGQVSAGPPATCPPDPPPYRGGQEGGTGPGQCPSGAADDVHRSGGCDCWTPGEAS